MAADKHSAKVKHTMQVFGWFHKFTDAGWKDKTAKTMEQQQEPGMADCILLPLAPYFPGRIFIEVKNGVGTSHERFAFDQWAERQRLFCIACGYSHIPYWLFLMMGTEIGAKRYPLQAWLMPGEGMFDLEWKAAPRKSLSYDTALTLLQKYQLTWVTGEDRWAIPDDHPFQSVLRGNYAARSNSTLRRDREGGRIAPIDAPETSEYQGLAYLVSELHEGRIPPGYTIPGKSDSRRGDLLNPSIWQPVEPDRALSAARDGDDAGLSGSGL